MLKFTLKYLIFAPTCVLSVHTPQTETHAATTLQNL